MFFPALWVLFIECLSYYRELFDNAGVVGVVVEACCQLLNKLFSARSLGSYTNQKRKLVFSFRSHF
jgi:hypothetical protein